MHHVGVVPTQWSAADLAARDLSQGQKHVDTAFSISVRNSRRFHVLNDQLIKSLWTSQAGRAELATDYELDVFANMVGTVHADTVVLTARILDKSLKGLIQEATTVSRDWFSRASFEEIQDTVTDLFFKLTNRLPIDVSVTSIQGRYVTISGGLTKGIHKGDRINLIRPFIASLHPANQYWLGFDALPLGTAEIIESKESTAVARLIALNQEGSVEIGDGAKINGIAGRTRFASQSIPENLPAASATIIVPPLYTTDSKKSSPAAADKLSPGIPVSSSSPSGKESKPPVDKLKQTAQEVAPPADATVAKPGEKPAEKSPGDSEKESEDSYLSQFYSPFKFAGISDVVAKVADRITFQIGQTKWWYVGPGDTGSKVQWYLPLNTIGARITREIIPQIKYGIGGGIGFGKTEHAGDYFSYDSHIRLYWETDLVLGGGAVQKLQLGAQGNFSGLSCNNERYGGGDWIQAGFFGGVSGQLAVPQSVDWYGEFAVVPLTIGRVGYDGSRKNVRASFGWRLGLGGYLLSAPQSIEWGGGFDYSGMNLHDSNSKETGLSTISALLLARYRF
jgi:hypothetical protein